MERKKQNAKVFRQDVSILNGRRGLRESKDACVIASGGWRNSLGALVGAVALSVGELTGMWSTITDTPARRRTLPVGELAAAYTPPRQERTHTH